MADRIVHGDRAGRGRARACGGAGVAALRVTGAILDSRFGQSLQLKLGFGD